MTSHLSIPVSDRSQVAAARQQARMAAERAGFNDTDTHRVGLVMTELASNLAKHAAPGGQVLLCARPGDRAEIELIAIDRGPGIANISQSMEDGHSTAGSAGTGLGAIRRLSDDFDIYSQAGKGTAVLARLRPARRAAPRDELMVFGGISVAMPGEVACGDAWTIAVQRGRVVVGVVDGLGHGVLAEAAAAAAVAALNARPISAPVEGLTTIHASIRHTRGAAATVALFDPRAGIVTVAGIGNVAAAVVGFENVRQAVSLAGILGHEVRQFREYQYPWRSDALLVMHSDGLISHWSLDGYPGLRQRHPVLAAAVMYRDYQRGRDDVTVVVGREAA